MVMPAGQIVGFLGPNGSGKTTTMRSIMGLVAIDRGSITWRGEPITDQVRHTVGSDPTSLATRVLSLIPPFAPLLMPLRMVTGAASIVEIVVAAVLLAISVVAMIRLAGSVYARTLLHRGSRLTWRDALRRTKSLAD